MMRARRLPFDTILGTAFLLFVPLCCVYGMHDEQPAAVERSGEALEGIAKANGHETRLKRDRLRAAIRHIQDEETLQLHVKHLWLKEQVVLNASNIVILGAEQGTNVHCPRKQGAFHIWGTNVTLANLNFTRCVSASTVTVGGVDLSEIADPNAVDSTDLGRFVESVRKHEVRVTNCMFKGSTAYDGPAIAAEHAWIRIDTSSFIDNQAYRYGGAILIFKSRLTVKDSFFRNNSALTHGGSVFLLQSLANVQGTDFSDSSGGHGGAICGKDCEAEIGSSSFVDCRGEMGGAFYTRNCRSSIRDSKFIKNTAPYAGALYTCQQSRLIIQASIVEDNVADFGGAVYSWSGTMEIKNSVFRRNKARYVAGAITMGESDFSWVYFSVLAIPPEYLTRLNANKDINVKNAESDTVEVSFLHISGSSFVENSAQAGGALYSVSNELTISTSTFSKNKATVVGGAICLRHHNSTFQALSSTFENNVVDVPAETSSSTVTTGKDPFDEWKEIRQKGLFTNPGGGVLAVEDVRTLDVFNCTFTQNGAKQGGVLVVGSEFYDTVLEFNNCTFEGNQADAAGGALYAANVGSTLSIKDCSFVSNAADRGGAICLSNFAKLRALSSQKEQLSLFEDNVAVYGGALLCDRCILGLDSGTKFARNVALEYGGAAYIQEAGMESNITDASFNQNVASYGGAIALRDCALFSLSGIDRVRVRFESNLALEGGALNLQSQYGTLEAYKIRKCIFRLNRALELDQMLTEQGNPTLERWQRQRREALAGDESDWLDSRKNFYGRGGGFFIRMHNMRKDASVSVFLDKLRVTENSAAIGGGGYIENDERNKGRESDAWCPRGTPVLKPCQFLNYSRVVIANNNASISGGGLFVQAVDDLCTYIVAKSKSWQQRCKTPGNGNTVRITKNKILSKHEGYGRNLATGAKYLALQNVQGTIEGLIAGRKFEVKKGSGGNSNQSKTTETIRVRVGDALNQRVTAGTRDSEISVQLVSDYISKKSTYNAVRGIVDINDTFVAGVDADGTLTIQSMDGRDLSVSLNFRTLPCSGGELRGESDVSCFRCQDSDDYALRPNAEYCRRCEPNAICTGTTVLVPKDGFWHANPFSPKMHRCLRKKSCRYDGRETSLKNFYNNSAAIETMLRDFDETKQKNVSMLSEGYKQCSDGTVGTLCGSCAAGYGHSPSGECKECDQDLAITRLLTAFITFLLFLNLTFKIILEVEDIRKDVLFEVIREKRAVRNAIRKAARTPRSRRSRKGQKKRRAGGGKQKSRTGADPNTSQEPGTSSAAQSGQSSSTEEASPRISEQKPLLLRGEAIEEPPLETDPEEEQVASEEVMEASGVLSDTYNVRSCIS